MQQIKSTRIDSPLWEKMLYMISSRQNYWSLRIPELKCSQKMASETVHQYLLCHIQSLNPTYRRSLKPAPYIVQKFSSSIRIWQTKTQTLFSSEYLHCNYYTLSSWNHHRVSLGDLPFLQFLTYLSLSGGLCLTVELDNMERMLMQIELTVMAGDQES